MGRSIERSGKMEGQLKILDVLVPLDDPGDCLTQHVWPVIRPHWTGKKVTSKTLSGGFVNRSVLFHLEEDVEAQQGVVVRLYKTARDPCHTDQYDELIYMQVAHHAGCISAVRAVLVNGVIYDYMPGQVIRHAHIRHPKVAPLIARAFAKLHWVDTTRLDIRDRAGRRTTFQQQDRYIPRMRQVLEQFNNTTFTPPVADKIKASPVNIEELRGEIDFVAKYLDGLDFPSANSHDDPHIWNILYHDKSGQVHLLDYELSGFHGLATNDLAFLLSMHIWNKDILTRHLPPDTFPTAQETEETERMWLTAYLSEKHELEGRGECDVTEQELRYWLKLLQINQVVGLCHRLVCLLLCVVRAEHPDFLLRLYEVARGAYYEQKPQLASLREEFLQLKSEIDRELETSHR